MGRAFKQYYNKHSNNSLKDVQKVITEDTNRLSLIQKCLQVPDLPPPSPPPKSQETPPPSPKIEPDRPKTDEELYEFYQQKMSENQQESEKYYFKWLETLSSTWKKRIEDLEFQRKKYNQKAGWTAEDVHATEEIDADIQYCQRRLQEILDDYDEFWSDSDCDSDC